MSQTELQEQCDSLGGGGQDVPSPTSPLPPSTSDAEPGNRAWTATRTTTTGNETANRTTTATTTTTTGSGTASDRGTPLPAFLPPGQHSDVPPGSGASTAASTTVGVLDSRAAESTRWVRLALLAGLWAVASPFLAG